MTTRRVGIIRTVSRLAILICANVVVAVYLVYWAAETKLKEPYDCDGLCQGAGIFAAILLVGLVYATWRTARSPERPSQRQ